MSIKPKRLLAELELHLNILDKLPYALLQLNRRGKIVWANLEANDLVGNNPVERHVGEIFPSPILSEAIEAAQDDKEGMRLEFRWARGVTRDLIASIVPLTTKTPQGAGWLSPCKMSPANAKQTECGWILLPTPATSFARRCRVWSASSKPYKARRPATARHEIGFYVSCKARQTA